MTMPTEAQFVLAVKQHANDMHIERGYSMVSGECTLALNSDDQYIEIAVKLKTENYDACAILADRVRQDFIFISVTEWPILICGQSSGWLIKCKCQYF